MLSGSCNISLRYMLTSHQVDKVLVADLASGVAISKGQQDFQFVRIQFGAVSCQEVSESLGADEARVLWVEL